MKFYEQFSIGDRVEVVRPPADGIILADAPEGARGTVIDKYKVGWLDPVSSYLVELDYPHRPPEVTMSGRDLRRLLPDEEFAVQDEEFRPGALVEMRVYEEGPTARGVLLPDAPDLDFTVKVGRVLEKRLGSRRNEPPTYLVQWDADGSSSWEDQCSLRIKPEDET